MDVNIIFEKKVVIKDIVVSPRPVWKCNSCEMYGRRLSCPPFVPSYKEAKEWIRCYERGLLFKFSIDMDNFENHKRNIIFYLLDRERKLFSQNNPYAFSLFPGSCNICHRCTFKGENTCMFPTKVRPSVDAIGIELSSLTEIDFKESVLYSLILVK